MSLDNEEMAEHTDMEEYHKSSRNASRSWDSEGRVKSREDDDFIYRFMSELEEVAGTPEHDAEGITPNYSFQSAVDIPEITSEGDRFEEVFISKGATLGGVPAAKGLGLCVSQLGGPLENQCQCSENSTFLDEPDQEHLHDWTGM